VGFACRSIIGGGLRHTPYTFKTKNELTLNRCNQP
jgi:hypothetical protein